MQRPKVFAIHDPPLTRHLRTPQSVIFMNPHKFVILSEVARVFCELRSRRTPKVSTLPIQLEPFLPLQLGRSCKGLPQTPHPCSPHVKRTQAPPQKPSRPLRLSSAPSASGLLSLFVLHLGLAPDSGPSYGVSKSNSVQSTTACGNESTNTTSSHSSIGEFT